MAEDCKVMKPYIYGLNPILYIPLSLPEYSLHHLFLALSDLISLNQPPTPHAPQ